MEKAEPLNLVCANSEKARHVVSLLLSRDVSPADLVVCSAGPIHELEDLLCGPSRLRYFVLGGALAGAIGGFALASVTARLYPLATGGMPVVAFWPVGIVTYEAMMLVAILFTVVGLLVEGRLLRRVPGEFYANAPRISEGEVLVLVHVRSARRKEELLEMLEKQ
jgi:hypothetical protein